MKKRNLYFETDTINETDEPFQVEVDNFSVEEQNDYLDYLMSFF